jgi:hypothetical protein
MAIEIINVGSSANDGTGDTIREAFIKVNDNFAQAGAVPIRRAKTIANKVYCGIAPTGSSEDDAVWTITTITVALDGTTTSVTETDQVWTGYDE